MIHVFPIPNFPSRVSGLIVSGIEVACYFLLYS